MKTKRKFKICFKMTLSYLKLIKKFSTFSTRGGGQHFFNRIEPQIQDQCSDIKIKKQGLHAKFKKYGSDSSGSRVRYQVQEAGFRYQVQNIRVQLYISPHRITLLVRIVKHNFDIYYLKVFNIFEQVLLYANIILTQYTEQIMQQWH